MKDERCIEQRLIDAICDAIRDEAGVHSCLDGPMPESLDMARLPAVWVTEDEYDLRIGQLTFDPLTFPLLTVQVALAYPCTREDYEREGRKYRAAIESAMYRDEQFGGLAVQSKYLGAQIGVSEVPGTGLVLSRWEIEFARVRKDPYRQNMEV